MHFASRELEGRKHQQLDESIVTGCACAVLMRLGLGTINKEPFGIRTFHQRVEDSRHLADCRPGIEALMLIERVPAAKGLG